MYKELNEEQLSEFRECLDLGAVQHLRGQVRLTSGGTIYFGDWSDHEAVEIIGTPGYTRQCTASTEEFAIGQTYTGTASVTLVLSDHLPAELIGAELTMELSVEGCEEWVLLGTWTINDPRRSVGDRVQITAVDAIAKLDVAIPDKTVGIVDVRARMLRVTELTGVEFAQTHEQVEELMGGSLWGTTFCTTCRAEVCAIAEMIGGFAFANRSGQIEFRRFDTDAQSARKIPANLRHKTTLREYTYGIRGISYLDQWGFSAGITWSGYEVGASSELSISSNPYIWDSSSEDTAQVERQYRNSLSGVANVLKRIPIWIPGQTDIYGDPTLDPGDLVLLEGGITGGSSLFLITADNWQFRAPQTLISAGAAEGGSRAQSGGMSSTQQAVTNINVTKNIVAVYMEEQPGELTDQLRCIAEGAFSVRSETVVFVSITVNAAIRSASELRVNVLYDGVKQRGHYIAQGAPGERKTAQLLVPITAAQGEHTCTVEAAGDADAEVVTAVIFGQNITPEQPDPANAGDYEYTVSGGSATVTRYIGTSRKPSIPSRLGGAPVRAIDSGAFTGTGVEYVYIPEGVEEIR